MRTAPRPRRSARTPVTFRPGPDAFHTAQRFGMSLALLPMSLSSGTRQKFGTRGRATSARLPARNDAGAREAVPIDTLNDGPAAVKAGAVADNRTSGSGERARA